MRPTAKKKAKLFGMPKQQPMKPLPSNRVQELLDALLELSDSQAQVARALAALMTAIGPA